MRESKLNTVDDTFLVDGDCRRPALHAIQLRDRLVAIGNQAEGQVILAANIAERSMTLAVDRHDGRCATTLLVLQSLQPAQFPEAGLRPRLPEIKQDRLPAETAQSDATALVISEESVRRLFAGLGG